MATFAADVEVTGATAAHQLSEEDAAFIAAREAEEAAEFKKAVEDWRMSKAQGGGEAVIAEVGGCFASDAASATQDKEEESIRNAETAAATKVEKTGAQARLI